MSSYPPMFSKCPPSDRNQRARGPVDPRQELAEEVDLGGKDPLDLAQHRRSGGREQPPDVRIPPVPEPDVGEPTEDAEAEARARAHPGGNRRARDAGPRADGELLAAAPPSRLHVEHSVWRDRPRARGKDLHLRRAIAERLVARKHRVVLDPDA